MTAVLLKVMDGWMNQASLISPESLTRQLQAACLSQLPPEKGHLYGPRTLQGQTLPGGVSRGLSGPGQVASYDTHAPHTHPWEVSRRPQDGA